ncbi:MAG: NGG1p interacting factor NIF3 [Firmicutes bacterium]|nr:NGG1p interacting factor NIF3 [Bacillota bacterium]
MHLKELYELAIALGMEADPRGKRTVEQILQKTKAEYEKLEDEGKEEFDLAKLTNPYADTRISYGDPKLKVKKLITGVDVDVADLMLADHLRRNGNPIDLVISHHPSGLGSVRFSEVMYMQADMLHELGVPINVAEGILQDRVDEVRRRTMPSNHYRVVDAARLLDMPLMCMHTPADNNVQRLVQRHVDAAKPSTLEGLIKVLKEIPEYKEAAKLGIGPNILAGKKESRCGKIAVSMTGGTGGPKADIEELVKAGVGTVVEMHISDEKLEEAKKHHLNIVIAGHMASDSIGMNIILDEFEKKGVEIMTFSGLIRHRRF